MINKNRIATGLRALNKNKMPAPDYFLAVITKYDMLLPEKILGIPVIYTGTSVQYTPYGDSDCNVIPVWVDGENVNNITFERAYEDS